MLKTGKLDSDLLKQIVIDKINYKRPEVLTRAGVGEDCAVVDYGDYECVMSTDPITAAVSDIGRLAIHISCNDIASNGIQPLGIMLAVMLPVGTTEEDIELIMDQAAKAAEACEVEIIGGHTEITAAVNQPVIVSTAIGRGRKNQSASAENIQIGDVILMTKSAGLEGTGIIAGDYAEELRAVLSAEELEQASELLDHVSVVRDGVTAGAVGTHGMHDITEGGILGAVWEMCQISHVGAEVWEDSIPILPETEKICAHFDINPLRLISSGSMVIIVPKEKKEEMEKAMEEAGVPASVIGIIREEKEDICLISRTETCGVEGKGRIKRKIDPPYADELYKVVGKK